MTLRTPLRRRAPLAIASVVAVALALLVAPPATQASAPSAPTVPAPSYLFTVESASGSTTPLSPRGTGERFTLTLDRPAAVTMFTDRPYRRARLISPAALDQSWETWFASSPPNAVLTWNAGSGKPPASFVVALTNPRYDGTTDTLAFTALRVRRLHDPVEKGPNWKRQTTPASFTGASLFIDSAGSVTVNGCTITSGASCPGADLTGANLSWLTITQANFAGAIMRNVRATGTALFYNDLSGVDFTGADLSQTYFAGGSLAGANLSGLDLTSTNLDLDDVTDANFSNSLLVGLNGNYFNYAYANFSGADLTNASLEMADFTGANLTGANLTGADLLSTEFSGANLTGAIVDLSKARTDGYTTCPDGSRGPCVAPVIVPPNINDREPGDPGCEQYNILTGKWETVPGCD